MSQTQNDQRYDQPKENNYRHDGDEIDLRELVSIVIDGWKWVVFTPIAALVIASVMIINSTPSYTTEFTATPAAQQQFQALSSTGNLAVDLEQIYFDFITRLNSFDNFRQINQQNPQLLGQAADEFEDDIALLRFFNNRFAIERGGEPVNNLTVQYNYSADENGVVVLTDIVDTTADRVWRETVTALEAQNRASIRQLERRIDLQQETIRTAREDRLFELEQAIAIARELGVELPTTPQDYGRQPRGNEVIYANIGTDGALPLYFLGYRTLQAEKAILENAIDQSLQNSAIRLAQEQLREYRNLATVFEQGELEAFLGVDDLKPVERLTTVISYPYQPANSNATGKSLILALALVLGGFTGLMMTFIVRFVSSVRAYRKGANQKQGHTSESSIAV